MTKISSILNEKMWTQADKIKAERISPNDFVALIEITKGSNNKYELDKETGYIILDRILYTATHYPANYGLIPRTLCEDGDHLDVLVLSSEPIMTNALVRCYPIGMISMVDQEKSDNKIIAIPFRDPAYQTYKDINQMPKHIFDEMKHFFQVYKNLEGKITTVDKISGPDEAKRTIKRCMKLFEEVNGTQPKNL